MNEFFKGLQNAAGKVGSTVKDWFTVSPDETSPSITERAGQSVANYFAPAPYKGLQAPMEYRTRDVVKEVPGAVKDVAIDIARAFPRAITSTALTLEQPIYKMLTGKEPQLKEVGPEQFGSVAQFFLGDDPVKTIPEEGAETLRGFGVEEENANNLGWLVGVPLTALDAYPGLPGKKKALELLGKEGLEQIARTADESIIGQTLRGVGVIEKDIEKLLPRLRETNVIEEVAKIIGKTPGKKLSQAQDAAPVFEGLDGLTLRSVEKLKGRSTVSRQFIEDLANQPDLKQPERDLIRSVLATMEGDTIPVAEFANKVQTELLPLSQTNAGNAWEGINLSDDLRGPVDKYETIIYESPVPVGAGRFHFESNEAPNYFAHVRVEDMQNPNEAQIVADYINSGEPTTNIREILSRGGTRRVIEVQSDLFQKGRLEGEYTRNVMPRNYPSSPITPKPVSKVRKTELAKLEPYRNTWHERVIREEVERAAQDGKSKLQFPTGETAMKIEGLGGNNMDPNGGRGWRIDTNPNEADIMNLPELNPGNMKVGQEIVDITEAPWIITEVLGEGRFKAVPVDIWNIAKNDKNPMQNPDVIGRSESFDISGKIDTDNPIFRFYEKEIGRYLKNKFGAKLVTDNNGVTWWEIDIPVALGKTPVEAFGVGGGFSLDEEGNVQFDPKMAAAGIVGLGVMRRAKNVPAFDEAAVQGRKAIEKAITPKRYERLTEGMIGPDEVRVALEAQRRGTIPHAELAERAAKIPVSITKLAQIRPGTVTSPEQAEAYSQVLTGFRTNTLKKLRQNYEAKPDDVTIRKQYESAQEVYKRAMVNLMAIRSEFGRGLEATKIEGQYARTPLINQNIQKVRSMLEPEQQVRFDMALDGLENIENPTEIMDFLTKWNEPGFMAKVVEFYRASLLSGVTTQVVNATGNGINVPWEIAVRANAGGMDWARAAITGSDRQVYASEALYMLRQGFNSLPSAAVHAFRAMADEHYALQFNRALVESGSRIPAIRGTKGKVIRYPYRFLQAMDIFFRVAHTNMQAESLAYRRAMQEGLQGEALWARVANILDKPPVDFIEEVGARTDRLLFLEDFDGIMKTIEDAKNRHPSVQFIIPFYRTLGNLMREAYRMSPARIPAMVLGKDALTNNPSTRMEEISRVTLGTLFGMYLVNAIVDGRLEVTGAAPSDVGDRDVFYGVGKQPYSIRVGDSWVPYGRLQPFSTILFSASKIAEAYELFVKRGEMDPDQVEKLANSLTSDVAQFLLSQTAFQGVTGFIDFLEGGKYGQGIISAAPNYLQNVLSGFVPNILFSLTRAIDPTIYQIDSVADAFKRRIPGMQDSLVPSRDATGEVAERAGSGIERFVNPFVASKDTNDPVYEELERIGASIGFPQRKAYGIDLSQAEYDILLQDIGPRIRSRIEEAMQNPSYQRATDAEKADYISTISTRVRSESLSKLFRYHYERNKEQQKLINAGWNPGMAARAAEEKWGLSEEDSVRYAQDQLRARQEAGTTPYTMDEFLKQ